MTSSTLLNHLRIPTVLSPAFDLSGYGLTLVTGACRCDDAFHRLGISHRSRPGRGRDLWQDQAWQYMTSFLAGD
jgi:hypothetical protein